MKGRFQCHRNPFTNNSSEIGQLTAIIQKSLKENRQILWQIISADPSQKFQLYTPIKHDGVAPEFLKPLLLKQIDHLIQEKNTLLKKQSQLQFIQQKGSQQTQELQSRNTYTALRQAWTKFDNKDIGCAQHIDNLNKIVGMIKKNMIKIIETEKNEEVSYQRNTPIIINQGAHMSYGKIRKEEIERLRMRNQQLEGTIYQLTAVIDKKNKKISHLEQQLAVAGSQMKKSLEMFSSNINKIKSLEEIKHQFKVRLQELKLEKEKSNKCTKIYEPIYGEYLLKLESPKLTSICPSKTKRSLEELILFLSSDAHQMSVVHPKMPEIQLDFKNDKQSDRNVPILDLSTARSSGFASFTERHSFKPNKFISYKTPRNNISMTSEISQTQSRQNSSHGKSRKFTRTGNLGALTTDRFRNNKTIADIDISLNLDESNIKLKNPIDV